MKKLPIGKQHIIQFKEQNLIYVDKTKEVYKLISEPNYYFYTRPRRFGKSLTVDVLKNIYLGNKALFENYWIYDKIEWQKHPVVHIDFANLDFYTKSLSLAITDLLDEIGLSYQLNLETKSPKDKFKELINQLSRLGKVVILIDEYDKPLTDYITDAEKAEENQAILREFLGVLKPLGDKIEMLFITGIARFSKVSLFSVLNNLKDITFHSDFAALVGITQEELEKYFKIHIKKLADELGTTYDHLLSILKQKYNGYSWDGKVLVYNPFSIINALDDLSLKSFWFTSGTPKFLIKLMKKRKESVFHLESLKVDQFFFEAFDVHNNIEIEALLFQTGYLTIKKKWYENFKIKYELGFPNQEVKEAFYQNLLEIYTDKKQSALFTVTEELAAAFKKKNIESIEYQLNILLSDISYHLFPRTKKQSSEIRKQQEFIAWEGYFHTIVYIVLQYIGINIQCEVTKKGGRMDAVIQVENYIYIIEFKLDDAKLALEQIKERDYAQSFQNTTKEIILMGIAFDRDKKVVLPIKWETRTSD